MSTPTGSSDASRASSPGTLDTGSILVIDRARLRRAVRGTFVGNLMEWYDVGVFGYLIVTMGPVFLPQAGSAAQVLFMLGTFASTYLFRPLGGMFCGWLGDRIGRQRVLFATLALVVAATFLIGTLPSYDAVGIWAALLLITLKIVQGFSAGGELTGAITFVSESAPDRKRGFYTAFLDAGSYLGFTLGAVFVTVLQVTFGQQAMEDGFWRIPFLVAAPLGVIAIYFRLRVGETPHFEQVKALRASGTTEPPRALGPFGLLRRYWRQMLQVLGLVAAANTVGYAFTSYMPTYLSGVPGFDAVSSNLVSVPLLIAMACSMPFVGMLSDRIGRKAVLWAASGWVVVLSMPAFLLLNTGKIGLVVLGLTMIGIPVALYMGALASTFPALFPTSHRYGGLGMSYNISVALFGGTAPLFIESLIRWSGDHLSAAYYLMAMSVVGILVVATLRESARQALPGSHPATDSIEEAHAMHLARSSAEHD
ncbi:MFS transporter [Saccharopolyspora sp. ASAGF58]|uniref:MFS transporter n=1 Tax=Saccharopolyspora sp. ASAGF58 TaxID=2719023 RepID=UPI00143FE731|nr:MFS transporter [Saccharopolyspora sp. ASAGF58]QIZ38836.1 MFS transporter [Saccharopolyspora sp. ASAGF58]